MKNIRLLVLVFTGCILFFIGLMMPDYNTFLSYLFMITGAFMVLLFYFITLLHVIKTFSHDSSKKIFWLIALVCVPVLGNIIYVIFRETANRRQTPHGVW